MATATDVSGFDALGHVMGKGDETVKLAALPVQAIVMPGFQRERIALHIAKIAREYDDTADKCPVVAFFRGALLCLDGQQRIAAAESLGRDKIHCLLVENVKTPERLADLFLKFNRDRKLLNAFQKYIAALTSKDRGTVQISKILADFMLEPAKSAAVNGKVPIGAITQIYEKGGADLLRRVLNIKTQAWHQTPSREANEGKTLLGLALFIGRYWDKIDDGRIIQVLRRHHPGYLLEATDQERGNFRAAYSDHLRLLYNKGVRGKARL